MITKAKLTIILKADSTVVAEVEDPALWQQVLSALHQNKPLIESTAQPLQIGDSKLPNVGSATNSSVGDFAASIGIKKEELEGALGPSTEEPYLHLNKHCWAAMKKATPQRGPKALSPSALAATLLALWLDAASIQIPTTNSLVLAILKMMGVDDKNVSRGVKNAKWLSTRAGGVVLINPAHINEAQEIAKKFCTKTWD